MCKGACRHCGCKFGLYYDGIICECSHKFIVTCESCLKANNLAQEAVNFN